MNFERGKDPKEAMNLGWKEIFESMKPYGWVLFTEKDLYQNFNLQYRDITDITFDNLRSTRIVLYKATLIILIVKNKFKILKSRYNIYVNQIRDIKDLPKVVFDFKKCYEFKINSRKKYD